MSQPPGWKAAYRRDIARVASHARDCDDPLFFTADFQDGSVSSLLVHDQTKLSTDKVYFDHAIRDWNSALEMAHLQSRESHPLNKPNGTIKASRRRGPVRVHRRRTDLTSNWEQTRDFLLKFLVSPQADVRASELRREPPLYTVIGGIFSQIRPFFDRRYALQRAQPCQFTSRSEDAAARVLDVSKTNGQRYFGLQYDEVEQTMETQQGDDLRYRMQELGIDVVSDWLLSMFHSPRSAHPGDSRIVETNGRRRIFLRGVRERQEQLVAQVNIRFFSVAGPGEIPEENPFLRQLIPEGIFVNDETTHPNAGTCTFYYDDEFRCEYSVVKFAYFHAMSKRLIAFGDMLSYRYSPFCIPAELALAMSQAPVPERPEAQMF